MDNQNQFTFSFVRKITATLLVLVPLISRCQDLKISEEKKPSYFPLFENKKATALIASNNDFAGVHRAIKNLQQDFMRVGDTEPTLSFDQLPSAKEIILIGTIEKNPLIDQLAKQKKIDLKNLNGKWESYIIQVVEHPFPSVDRALVIAGSDKRGTIYGTYEISRSIGVSPWYWWADVVPKKKNTQYISPERFVSGEPAVKYRGIFINDEEPSLGRFVVEKYGGFKHDFYEKVFELLLRQKANFLWPAMWWGAFNSDDPLNPELADEYGIVMSTSHHEPMMRAHAEWKKAGTGEWNYETNTEVLRKFWKEGIERMGNRESIVTLAMRGDGDMAMSAETKTTLLEKIVKDQRDIIREVTKKDVTKTPQVWAIYKEVQDYYDKGMRVPDDVTLLFCDDNWGNIRKLPDLKGPRRQGGYGIYYHFDYVGDPRNYKWINTNQISKVWEQMHLAYRYGVDRIWIVNVGDIKPMEFPISFFLDFAWNPNKWNANNLNEFSIRWCSEQFGTQFAREISEIIDKYTRFNARRKPELLEPSTYSQVNFREADNIISEYRQLEKQALAIYDKIQPELKDAYYQLVLYPVMASANLNDLYVTVGKNQLYAAQGRSSTNDLATRAKALFEKDKELSSYYNKTLANGKWNNMMNQIHIGYTYWQDPKEAVMPETQTVTPGAEAEMAVAVEGSENFYLKGKASLPGFYSYQKESHYLDVFNRGMKDFTFTASSSVPWIQLSNQSGRVEKEARIEVSIDWNLAPKGKTENSIRIRDDRGKEILVAVEIDNSSITDFSGFVETDHFISIEAEHFTKAVDSKEIKWQVIPGYGRTLSGVTTLPVTSSVQKISPETPHLEYAIFLNDTSTLHANLLLGTTLAFNANMGLKIGISLDDEAPTIINIHQGDNPQSWEKMVSDNVRTVTSKHKVKSAGKHTLKYWMIDPGIVLQKIILQTGGLSSSYLGPPESPRIGK
jgi:hypothetical protein